MALAVLALGACMGVPQRALIPVPPERIGDWIRRGLETPAAAGVPEPMRSLQPRAWIRAAYYRGDLGIEVSAYGFHSSANAAEAQRLWQPREGACAFVRGLVLVVCTSQNADTETVSEFAGPLEAAWFGSER
jgi:hypothetical protein